MGLKEASMLQTNSSSFHLHAWDMNSPKFWPDAEAVPATGSSAAFKIKLKKCIKASRCRAASQTRNGYLVMRQRLGCVWGWRGGTAVQPPSEGCSRWSAPHRCRFRTDLQFQKYFCSPPPAGRHFPPLTAPLRFQTLRSRNGPITLVGRGLPSLPRKYYNVMMQEKLIMQSMSRYSQITTSLHCLLRETTFQYYTHIPSESEIRWNIVNTSCRAKPGLWLTSQPHNNNQSEKTGSVKQYCVRLLPDYTTRAFPVLQTNCFRTYFSSDSMQLSKNGRLAALFSTLEGLIQTLSPVLPLWITSPKWHNKSPHLQRNPNNATKTLSCLQWWGLNCKYSD